MTAPAFTKVAACKEIVDEPGVASVAICGHGFFVSVDLFNARRQSYDVIVEATNECDRVCFRRSLNVFMF